MRKLLKIFGVGKSKRIKALRSFKKDEKTELRYHNPYFPNKFKESKQKQEIDFKYWFFKNDGWAYFGILILFIFTFSYLAFGTKYFIIDEINISGNNNISTAEINNNFDSYFNSKKLFILPVKNYLFFNSDKAKQQILDNISNQFAIESINIIKKWPNKINIEVTERVPGLTWETDSRLYYVDLDGKVSQIIANKEEVNADLPKIIDYNKKPLNINEQAISPELIEYIIRLHESLPKISVNVQNFAIPEISCQEQQYKAEKIIKQEIDETENQEIKEKKIEILEQYNLGEITVDQSLEMLENVKKEEQEITNVNGDAQEYIQWETVFVPIECDLVKVNTEINAITEPGYEIYFDSKNDIEKQLINLDNVLKQKIDKPENLQYIDLRFDDRIYYK